MDNSKTDKALFLSTENFLKRSENILKGISQRIFKVMNLPSSTSYFESIGDKKETNEIYSSILNILEEVEDHSKEVAQQITYLEKEMNVIRSHIQSKDEELLSLQGEARGMNRKLEEYEQNGYLGSNEIRSTNFTYGKCLLDNEVDDILLQHLEAKQLKIRLSEMETRTAYLRRKMIEKKEEKENMIKKFSLEIEEKKQTVKNLIGKKRNLPLKFKEEIDKEINTLEKEIGQISEQCGEKKRKFSTDILKLELQGNTTEKEIITYSKRLNAITPRIPKAQKYPAPFVAIVFTDVESSTELWEKDMDVMSISMGQHNSLLRYLIQRCNGYEVKTEGDAFMVAFGNISSAINWCIEVQKSLLEVEWSPSLLKMEPANKILDSKGKKLFYGLKVRMGIHTGYPLIEVNSLTKRADYHGPMVNLTSRITSLGRGGEITFSQEVFEGLDISDIKEEVVIKKKGDFKLKGITQKQVVYSIQEKNLKDRFKFFKNSKKAVPLAQSKEEIEHKKLYPLAVNLLNKSVLLLKRAMDIQNRTADTNFPHSGKKICNERNDVSNMFQALHQLKDIIRNFDTSDKKKLSKDLKELKSYLKRQEDKFSDYSEHQHRLLMKQHKTQVKFLEKIQPRYLNHFGDQKKSQEKLNRKFSSSGEISSKIRSSRPNNCLKNISPLKKIKKKTFRNFMEESPKKKTKKTITKLNRPITSIGRRKMQKSGNSVLMNIRERDYGLLNISKPHRRASSFRKDDSRRLQSRNKRRINLIQI